MVEMVFNIHNSHNEPIMGLVIPPDQIDCNYRPHARFGFVCGHFLRGPKVHVPPQHEFHQCIRRCVVRLVFYGVPDRAVEVSIRHHDCWEPEGRMVELP